MISTYLTAKRDYYDIMMKNKERGLLQKSTILRLKKIGIDLSDDLKEIETNQPKSVKSGQMEVSERFLKKQASLGETRKYEWLPESLVEHDDFFFEWINSMTFGTFNEKVDYERYEMYKAQAQFWYNQNIDPYDTDNFQERKELILQEYSRIEQNTLYFSMKYAWIKEGSEDIGKLKYWPKEHNAVIFYLLDCGYLLLIGKPRQIFATTTIGIYINKKLITQENFFMKFITEDEQTGKEILEDKVKNAFSLLPVWQRPEASRDFNKGFKLGKKIKKGEYGKPNSRIEVLAPSKTAVNGGSPQISLIDEIGNVPDLIPMIMEAMPTLYVDRNHDGKLQLVRQLIGWGTGVSDDRGKQSFQSFWTHILSLWERKEFRSALFVPLFLSWHTRCNEKTYLEAQKSYYAGTTDEVKKFSLEERKALFYMHYPSTWEDMFGAVTNKLVSKEIIDKSQKRIRKLSVDEKPIAGYFEPIYDYTHKYDETVGVPFRIIGARFIPKDDSQIDNDGISAYMYKQPQKWKNRYFQGTDPVQNDTGLSNFASVIWDKVDNTIACLIDYRKAHDPKAGYLQSLLMSLYYDTEKNIGEKHGASELIENNAGGSYKAFKEMLKYDINIVGNKELPMEYQGGGSWWGINCMQKRKEKVVGDLSEVIKAYHDNINHVIVFQQLDTFIPKVGARGVSWETMDRRLYKDDVLDALALAYLNSKINTEIPTPITIDTYTSARKVVFELVRNPNGDLERKARRV